MARMLLAEFADRRALIEVARGLKAKGVDVVDAFSPVPMPEIADLIGVTAPRMRMIMFLGGAAVAVLLYATEWYTAVIDYPVNSGGRPLHSWIPFMLPPFATGIFAAAVAGLIVLFVTTGLPQPHHALFALEGFERVTQDRFALLLARPTTATDEQWIRSWLADHQVLRLREIEE